MRLNEKCFGKIKLATYPDKSIIIGATTILKNFFILVSPPCRNFVVLNYTKKIIS